MLYKSPKSLRNINCPPVSVVLTDSTCPVIYLLSLVINQPLPAACKTEGAAIAKTEKISTRYKFFILSVLKICSEIRLDKYKCFWRKMFSPKELMFAPRRKKSVGLFSGYLQLFPFKDLSFAT